MKSMMFTLKTEVIIYIILLLTVIFACKKDITHKFDIGNAKLTVELIGISSEIDDYPNKKSATQNSLISDINQSSKIEIPINKNLSAYVSLEEDNITKTTLNTKNKKALADTSQLTQGVKYGILVYDGDNLIPNGHKVYVAGNEPSADPFELDGGKTYTFIAYSINSSLNIPEITNANKLSEAQIVNQSEDLLYFKHSQTVNTGDNQLIVVLKHKFTLVTTKLEIGTTYSGVIQDIENGQFDKIRQSATLNLLNGELEFSPQEKSSEIKFDAIPSGGVKTIASHSNLLIGPSSNNIVTYSFPEITINDTTASIPPLPLNLQIGKKYNLILTFDVPCRIEEFYFNNYEHYTHVIDSMYASFYRLRNDIPLTINFVKVDNNFNIYYNNKPVFEARYETVTLTRTRTFNVNNSDTTFSSWTNWNESNALWSNWMPHDADFQSAGGNSSIRTMKFSDESTWGQGSIGEIYNLTGTIEIPVVRIVFSNQGTEIGMSITGNKNPGNANALLPLLEIPHYSYSFSSLTLPPYPIYESTPAIITNDNATSTQTQKITSIRKSMDFRMNTSFPKHSNGKDYIRIKQSTMSMFPQGGEGPTQLRGFFTPVLKGRCEFP